MVPSYNYCGNGNVIQANSLRRGFRAGCSLKRNFADCYSSPRDFISAKI